MSCGKHVSKNIKSSQCNLRLKKLWSPNLFGSKNVCWFSFWNPSRIVHLHMDEVGFISQWRAILAGGLAGIAAALVTYPLEVTETRLIVQNCRQPTYLSVVHTLSEIYRTEGLKALYRGFSLTVLGAFTYWKLWIFLFCLQPARTTISPLTVYFGRCSPLLCWLLYCSYERR